MEHEYGQKAPALPDGSLLIQELKLTPAQTQQMASEKLALVNDYRAVMMKTVAIFLIDFFVSSAALGVIGINAIAAIINSSAASQFLIVVLLATVLAVYLVNIPVKKAIQKVHYKAAMRAINMVSESEVEPLVFPLVSRYMAGDKKMRVNTYLALVIRGESFLGSSKTNKLRLDTSDTESYSVREVVVS